MAIPAKQPSGSLSGLEAIPLDAMAIPQSALNIEDKRRSNLFPWDGQFSPQLVASLLQAYADYDSYIADPFMGSGTVVVEAAAKGLRAFGSDINPAPYKLASVYRLINVGCNRRTSILNQTQSVLDQAIPATSPLLGHNNGVAKSELKTALLRLIADQDCEHSRILLEAMVVLLDFYKDDLTEEKVFATWQRLRTTVRSLPYSRARVTLSDCDARRMSLAEDMVDLIITSPPYVNVFNYHQKYRASVEALGWDVLHVARSEIGSNRKHRGNRFLTVTQYCLDMHASLLEMCRVCKKGARIILIVGRESNVRKTPIYNGDIVARVAMQCTPLDPVKRQQRVFVNRYGVEIYEDILHFTVTTATRSRSPREIAREVLAAARARTPSDCMVDLEDAIQRVGQVESSPLYVPRPPTHVHTAYSTS